jgi:hypothetical protein
VAVDALVLKVRERGRVEMAAVERHHGSLRSARLVAK